MPAETNSLILGVESKGVTKAVEELKNLEKASGATEKATDGLANANTRAENVVKSMTDELSKLSREEKQLARETETLTRQKKKLTAQLGDVTDKNNVLDLSQKEVKSSTTRLTRELKKLELAEERLNTETASLTSRKKRLTASIDKNSIALRKNKTAISDARASTKSLGASMGSALPSILAVGAGIGIFTLALGGIKGSIRAAAEIETLETSFVSLVGSVEGAKKQVSELVAFAAATPFRLEGVAKAARQLIAAKGNTIGLQDELKVLGDIASTSAIPIDELAAIYSKAFNKGKIQAEELNQISERGIPIVAQLAKQFNVSKNEVFKLGSEGKLSFEDLKTAFQAFASEGGIAFDAMKRQSETLDGVYSTLKDNIKINSAIIGRSLAEAFDLVGVIENLSTLSNLGGGFFDSAGNNAAKNVGQIEKIDRVLNQLTKSSENLAKLKIDFDGTSPGLRKIEGIDKKFKTAQAEVNILTQKFSTFSDTAQQVAINNAILGDSYVRLSGLVRAQAQSTTESTQEEENQIQSIKNRIEAIKKRNESLEVTLEKEKAIAEQEAKQKALDERTIDTGLVDQFVKIEKSLQTQTEKIENEFAKSKNAVEAYQNELFEIGLLTEEEGERVAESLDRLATIRQNALDNLQNSNVGNELLKQFEIVESAMRTQTEIIEDQFDDRRVKIEEYMQSLILTGNLTATELDRITNLLARVDSAEGEALGNETPSPTRTTPTRAPRASRSSSVSARTTTPRESEFDKLKESLQSENKLIEESYIERLELIRKNTVEGSNLRNDLEMKLLAEHVVESEELRSSLEIDLQKGSFQSQLEQLNEFYEKRKSIILESSILTEQEKNEAISALERQRMQNQEQAENERNLRTIDATQTFLGNLESIQQTFGRRGAEIAKTAAIANATIDTARNAILAYQRGLEIPVIGNFAAPVFAAAATAAGLAQIATIKSQSVGNFENGGVIPGGSFRGDNITANVNSGEMILNTSQQRQLFDVANGGTITGAGSQQTNVTIINQTTRDIEGQAQTDENGNAQIIIREAKRQTIAELTAQARNGGGTLVPQLQSSFNLRRQGQ